MNSSSTPSTITPPSTRKPSVAHVDCLKAHITVLIPVDVTQFDTVKAANDIVAKLAEAVKTAKGHATVEASLGRARGDLFP